MMNIFAVGDIHGEPAKLKSLIDKLPIENDDKLIFLGDYINRGDKSFEAVDYLVELSSQYNCVFLLGNHEAMFINYLCGIFEKEFLFNGGKKVISSYAKHDWDISPSTDSAKRKIPKKHKLFFNGLRKYYETDDFIFVHAGIKIGVPMENQEIDDLVWSSDFIRSDYEGKTVVHGHYIQPGYVNRKHTINVDTGSGVSGLNKLTAVKLPDRVFYSQQ